VTGELARAAAFCIDGKFPLGSGGLRPPSWHAAVFQCRLTHAAVPKQVRANRSGASNANKITKTTTVFWDMCYEEVLSPSTVIRNQRHCAQYETK
jgi:hypothetical protein